MGIGSSRRFYESEVAPMIRKKFPEYEGRIAVGICGEGSDCFGYDDFISRDHDFGTGVCLWLTDDDMRSIGSELNAEYKYLVDQHPGNKLTERLRARRGCMTISGFYSKILGTELSASATSLSDDEWNRIDHACLATAVNGTVFRDDLGVFTSFRRLLLDYYPDNIWRIRLANELHKYAASLQVNYARCMCRGDWVAARLCHMQGLEAAMQLYFLLKRQYPPYYKWTFRRLEEIDRESVDSSKVYGGFSTLIKKLADEPGDKSAWEGIKYSPNYINLSDPMIVLAERIAGCLVDMMNKNGLTDRTNPYLETYVDEILKTR